MLTFLAGETTGSTVPWPDWTHSDDTLLQVARWMRVYHDAVAGFVPPAGALWRMGGRWRPGLIIGHNDAAPYNAVWRNGRLAGFFDWDMAGPVTADWDLAFAAFSWVPLHARHVVEREGFTDFAARPARLRRFLAEYGWTGRTDAFLAVVRDRITAHVTGLRELAATGEPLFGQMIAEGKDHDLEAALAGLDEIS
jgi:aminoglycoside phosphotransferase (APT) family kinase protein